MCCSSASNLLIDDIGQRLRIQRLIRDHRIDPIHELRRKFPPHRVHADVFQFLRRVPQLRPPSLRNRTPDAGASASRSRPGCWSGKSSCARNSPWCCRPAAAAALSSTPSSSRVMLGAAFSISSNSTSDRSARFAGHAVQLLLRQHRRRLAMPQIPRRRADQLRHFMLHLKFAAVHSQQLFLAAVQRIAPAPPRCGSCPFRSDPAAETRPPDAPPAPIPPDASARKEQSAPAPAAVPPRAPIILAEGRRVGRRSFGDEWRSLHFSPRV